MLGVLEISLEHGQIRRWSEPVLKYIGSLWENPVNPAEVVQAISCFSAWVQLGVLHNVELQTYERIVLRCFEELDSNNVEVSCSLHNVLCLERRPPRLGGENLQLMQLMEGLNLYMSDRV